MTDPLSLDQYHETPQGTQGSESITPSQRQWRSLVRISGVSRDHFYFTLPGWEYGEVIELPLRDLPEDVRGVVIRVEVEYLHVKVNLGAEVREGLYFEGWEAEIEERIEGE